VTRASVITLLKEMGYKVEERPVNIHEIIDAYKSGVQVEAFGQVQPLRFLLSRSSSTKIFVMHFDVEKWKAAPASKPQ
jgi:branched-chain amino acid aminotransferase